MNGILTILRETGMLSSHKSFVNNFGITEKGAAIEPVSLASTLYALFVQLEDAGESLDTAAYVSSCLNSCGVTAKRGKSSGFFSLGDAVAHFWVENNSDKIVVVFFLKRALPGKSG